MPLLLSIIQKSKCQTSLGNEKEISTRKDTKEKTACKLVAVQASTFCTIPNFVVLPILNNCSKRKFLQSEELLAEHVNDKLSCMVNQFHNFFFMKVNVKKSTFIFNRTNYLHNNKFNQLDIL
jgi:hypothetical protein